MDGLALASVLSSGVVGVGGLAVAWKTSKRQLDAQETARREGRQREDVVWRRENALASAAEYLAAESAVHVLARTVEDLGQAVLMAEQAGQTDSVQQLTAKLDQEQANKRQALERASDALSRLSILLAQETYIAASRHLEAVTVRPRDPQNAILGAALNNLLRADLGLPARVIDPATALTADQALDKIEEARQQGLGSPE